MTDSMKFGPEWLRNMSNDNLNNTANNNNSSYNNNTGGGGGGTTMGPRYQLAEYRYGREEMLSLYDKNTKAPEILPSYKKLFVEKLQCPLALIPTTDEDSPPAQSGGVQPRPWGVLRSPVFGSGAPIRGTGRGGSVDRGRGGRTRGTFHTSSNYQRPTALYDEDIRGIGKTGGERWHERNGISDSIGQLTNDWNGSPSSSPRKEFTGNSISHGGGSGTVTSGGGGGISSSGGRGTNMENWRRTRMDEDSTGGGSGINAGGNVGINDGWRGGTVGNPAGPGSTYRWARSTSWRDDDSNNISSSTNETQLSTSGISGIGSIQRSFSTTSSVDHRNSSTCINTGTNNSTSTFLGSTNHQIQGSVGGGSISSMKQQQHTTGGRNSVPWGGGGSGNINNTAGNDNLSCGDHDDSSLPEWAMANPIDSGGSFDATGAFHGSNDEDDDSGSKMGMGDSKIIRLNSNNEINKNNFITNGSKDRKSSLNITNSNTNENKNNNKIDSVDKDSQIIKDRKFTENKLNKNIEKNNNNFNNNNSTININDNSNINENNINKKLSKVNQLIGNDFKKSDNRNDQKHDEQKLSKQITSISQQSSLPIITPLNTKNNNNKFLELSDRMQEVADDMVAKLITDDESINTMKKSNSSNSSGVSGGGVNVNQMLKTNSTTTSSTIVEQIHHHHHQKKPQQQQQQQSQEHQSSLTHPTTTSHSTLISPSVVVQQQQQSSLTPQQSQSTSSSNNNNNTSELWYYRDPQGKVQGSFTANEMAEWYRAGYFDENLYVRRICDSRFAALGELVKLCGNSMPFLSSHLIPPLTETLSQSTTLQQQQQQQQQHNHLPHQQQLTPQQNAHQLHNISGQQQHIGAPGINHLPSTHQQQSPTQQQQQQHPPIPGVVTAINATLNKNNINPLLVDGNNSGQQQSTDLETITLIQQFHYLQKQYILKQRSQIIQNLTNSDTWNLLTREQQQQIINQRMSQIIYPDYLMNLQALSNTLSMGTPASYTLHQMLAGAKNEIIQTKITPNWLYNSLGIGQQQQQQQQHHNIGGVVDTISSIFNNSNNEFTTGSGGTGSTTSSTIVDNQINLNNLLQQQSSNNHHLPGVTTGQSTQIPNHQNTNNNNNNVTSVDNDPIKSLFMQLQMQKNAAAFASLASVALTGGGNGNNSGNAINHWPTNLTNHIQQSHQQQQQQQESPAAWSAVAGGGNGINHQQTIDILNQNSSINMWDYPVGISAQQKQKVNEMKTEQQIIEEQIHNDKLNRQTDADVVNEINKYIQHNVVTHHYQDQQQQQQYKLQHQDLPLKQLTSSSSSSYNIQIPNKKDERIHNNATNNKVVIDEKNLQQQHKSNNNQQVKNDDDLLNKQQKSHISSLTTSGKNNNANSININLNNNKKDNTNKKSQQQQINDDDRIKRELIDDKRKQKEEKKQRQQQLDDEQRKRQQQEDEKRREQQQQIEEEKRQKDIEVHRRRVLMEAYQVASDAKKQQQQQRSSGPSSVAPWSNTGLSGITSPGPNFAEIQKAERERRAEEQRLEQLLETQRKTQQMEIIAAKETTTLKWKNPTTLVNNVKSLTEIQAEEAKRLANEQSALAIADQNRRKDHEQQSAAVAQSSSTSNNFNTNPFNTIWNNRTTQNIVWNSNNSIGNIISTSTSGNNNNSSNANNNINTTKVWGGTSTSSAGFWEEPTKITSSSSSTNHTTTAASVLANAIQHQQQGNKNQNRIGLSKSQTIGSMQTVRKDNNNITVSAVSTSVGNFKQPISSNKPQQQQQQNKNLDDKTNGNKKKKDVKELNASGSNIGATGNSSNTSSSKKDDARNEFTSWCIKALSSIGSGVDVPTFISFLQDIESPFEVKDYIRVYLGETKDCTEFGKQFLERRSKYKNQQRAQNAHIDDMCVPAPAINPSSNEFQEGKGKKIKKSKMTRLDARILGFSVTAAQDRINVGDRDYGDAS